MSKVLILVWTKCNQNGILKMPQTGIPCNLEKVGNISARMDGFKKISCKLGFFFNLITIKMKHTLLFIAAFFMALLAFAKSEQSYYYADGERITLQVDEYTLVLHFHPELSEKAMRIEMQDLANVEVHEVQGRALLTFSIPVSAKEFDEAALGFAPGTLYSIEQGLKLEDGFKMALTHDVVLQFAPGFHEGQADVAKAASEYNAIYQRDEYGTLVYRVAAPMDGLAFANALEEMGAVEWAHPDFYAKVTRYNDPFYGQQFQMNNTGQSVNGFAGVAGIDCNAPDAWALTTGSASLTVAVIDDGLEAHEDLVGPGGVTRVLGGNTPATGGSGTPRFSSDAHGMACAGILAATHNNSLGVRGVAPGVNLRSVNIFWGGETTQQIANGINWARTQGVDVMSNSWGYTSCTVSYSNINSALSSARTLGRGGKGCIVVFASGNGGKSCIDYPANRSDVMAVGSVTNQGQHSNYSNRGSQLSLVAPSDASPGQAGAFVRTIDRMGSVGYDSGNYYAFFGGTSAACPVVAGVAALVLSVDPELTEAEVRSLMQSTANDMGSSGFDTFYGHGRVNAGAAVAAASTEPVVCELESLTLSIVLDNYPGETTWQVTSEGGSVVASGGNYAGGSPGSTVVEDLCLPSECYTLTIFDSFGDGICCSYGLGSYSLTNAGGDVLASGGQFGSSESTAFCTTVPCTVVPPACVDVEGTAYQTVTGNDAFCCENSWDSVCQDAYDALSSDCTVAEPPACASPYPAISNLQATVLSNGVNLSWIGVEGSTFCNVNGSLASGAGDRTVTSNLPNLNGFFIPQNQLPVTGTYRVRVRCGCSQNPLIVAPYSEYVFFYFVKNTITAPDELFGAVDALEFNAWPNPSAGEVQVSIDSPVEMPVDVRLFDLLGKQVFAERQSLIAGQNLLRFDFARLEPAMYLMQLDGAEGVLANTRIVIRR
jgi:subtilisin family serine protease